MNQFAICCLGCKVNTYEAESIGASLKEKGYEEVDFKEKADIYCVFTCAVTNTAASKSRQKIHQAIRQNPDAVVCVVGCYVQLNADEMAQEEHIDILVGSSNKREVPTLIEQVMKKKERQIKVEDVRSSAQFEALPLQHFAHRTRAYLKVQDGCNQFCSYCIIPYARGKERCLPLEQAIEQASALAQNHDEIVLAGIHTGRYGHDENVSLVDLIRGILSKTAIKRIRISSIEITEVTDELIALIKEEPRVARHLHIPVQAGADATLKRMNRPYTTEQFYQRIKWIRQQIPNISISTDLIVGFVQESEEEFMQTRQFLSKAAFSFLHVFPFSSKSGTAASAMKGHVPSAIKKQRVKECLAYSQQCKIQYTTQFIGKTMDVLIEKSEDGISFGHTSEYIPVKLNEVHPVGAMIHIIGTHMIDYELVGKEHPYEAI